MTEEELLGLSNSPIPDYDFWEKELMNDIKENLKEGTTLQTTKNSLSITMEKHMLIRAHEKLCLAKRKP